MASSLSSSPPVLPIPRQPSPLSFSSISVHDPPSPPASSSSQLPSAVSLSSSPTDIYAVPCISASESSSKHLSLAPPQLIRPKSSRIVSSSTPVRVPVEPLPDSLLLRSTFNALENSTSTLKRLSKSVLASSTAYLALLEQVERAEADLFSHLGQLGKWLEAGYGLSGFSIWDDEVGIRKVRLDARRREREEIEVMVEHSLRTVKGELKRNGLAGGNAQAKFEQNARQFYQQTSDYLAPNASSSGSNTHEGLSSSTQGYSHSPRTRTNGIPTEDLAQASRLAQFDLARYSHHSTLLYAVPPTSITCLDLLVGLYNWTGGLLAESPEVRQQSFTRRGSQFSSESTTPKEQEQAELNTALNLSSRVDVSTSPSAKILKSTMSNSLAQLASIRGDLLRGWAKRNSQTTELEEVATERQAEMEGGSIPELPSPRWSDNTSRYTSANGSDPKRNRKMHKLHRSVGGRLRDFLSSSGSSSSLVNDERVHTGERTSRASFDGPFRRPEPPRPVPPAKTSTTGPILHKLDDVENKPSSSLANPTPRRPSTTSLRPSLQPRHSMHATRAAEYVSPFMASQVAVAPLPFESSPDLRLGVRSYPTTADPDTPRSSGVGGVGGLGAGGDEDEQREEAGRKKEGVLWGAGTWESLGKQAGKGKWENFWVVLDRSRIYEYRDNNLGKPDSAHAVIDLKFASVREGRGTDRRFVFEIVTPTQGRRLYQATSEFEMKQWLYAICNAIESCINGTSSVRTFDASKLRTVSGSLDDHALPTHRLFPTPHRGLGLGMPLSGIGNTPGARRSMPPAPRSSVAPDMDDRRQRKTSLKKVLRQSAEIAGEKWNNVMNNRNSSGLDMPRPSFLAQTGRSGSKTSASSTEAARPTSMIGLDSSLLSQSSRSNISDRSSWLEETPDDIEKRVMEMAGLGLGQSAGLTESVSSGRRSVSDSISRSMTLAKLEGLPTSDISRTRSAEAPPPVPPLPSSAALESAPNEQVDMQMLRRVADLPENRQCADCRKSMKSSRWATLSLREVPMVMFLCIRCVGIHRSLGTHISKPRSVDLDIWTPDSIILAKKWGNERGNAIWEHTKASGVSPSDHDVADYIRSKYVEGKWLGSEQRVAMGLPPLNSKAVGRAL